MNKDYRYQLENRKLTGKRQQKFTCPNCGKKKCFVRYGRMSRKLAFIVRQFRFLLSNPYPTSTCHAATHQTACSGIGSPTMWQAGSVLHQNSCFAYMTTTISVRPAEATSSSGRLTNSSRFTAVTSCNTTSTATATVFRAGRMFHSSKSDCYRRTGNCISASLASICSVNVPTPTSVLWRARRRPSSWQPVSHSIFGWLLQAAVDCLPKRWPV